MHSVGGLTDQFSVLSAVKLWLDHLGCMLMPGVKECQVLGWQVSLLNPLEMQWVYQWSTEHRRLPNSFALKMPSPFHQKYRGSNSQDVKHYRYCNQSFCFQVVISHPMTTESPLKQHMYTAIWNELCQLLGSLMWILGRMQNDNIYDNVSLWCNKRSFTC